MISTPSRSAAHVFLTKYCLRAQGEGNYLHRTIYDAPHITKDILEKYKAEAGGEESATWQREYLAKVVVDEEIAVIPEFATAEATIVAEVERPEFFDTYVSIDIGYHDLTAVLFAYYHFPLATVVVEDELVFLKTNSGAIASAAKEKERELWGHQEPVTRFIDASQHLVRDLSTDHCYQVNKVRRDDRDAAINKLRLLIADHRVFIHPRCRNTIAHLKGAVWNQSRTKFARSGKLGHFDCVAALVYLCRYIGPQSNPFPPLRGVTRKTHHVTVVPPSREKLELSKLMRSRRRKWR